MQKIIHIVEDDEDIRYIVCYILQEIGYKVVLSDTITEFRRKMDVSKPDLILLDVMLPDGNGMDLCAELEEDLSTKEIPVIIMSAHATQNDIVNKTCAIDFIAKPFDLDDLTEMLGRHLPL